ncbi:MAG: maltodextrin glucosidase [Chloroflexi bacterium CFX4]|nr:maltodextrin glucosidase [Chloroflexi bacterium CFX4]MDL1923706.1 maltodextrin glucosidase [Chloroflexi bacterium CFX3]
MTYASLDWRAAVHHDGSALYVSNPLPNYGERVQITLRLPIESPVTGVALRSAPDGEQYFSLMQEAYRDATCRYFVAELLITMPVNGYRFRLLTDEGIWHYNQHGIQRSEPLDHFDFKLLANFAAPSWLRDAVFYQIFPDRFYNGDPSNDVPPGAWSVGSFTVQQRIWGEPVMTWKESGNLDFFGGDLVGIAQKLDYLTALGVSALYLNPIFAARSNHRYDVTDFHNIDPYLGGNVALANLRAALDAVNMRMILDVTLNHCGWFNRWFTEAQADANAPTAEYFTFYNHPEHYEMWLGVPSLPKLNYRSMRLREVMYRAADSVLRRWLQPPYRVDGWRLDVANMQGRQGAQQLGHEIGREIRSAVKGDGHDRYLMGENFFDGTPHLQGDELDAVMNYQGFTMPLWRWLGAYDHGAGHYPLTSSVPISAETLAAQWATFRAAVPFVIARQQYNQLDSHDTRRFLSIVQGDKALAKLGAVLMFTYLGVPSVYYGNEIGLAGENDPDNRRCMIWDAAGWDHDLLAHYKRLIALRRQASALCDGGLQHLYADSDLIAYQRQSAAQRLIVIGSRAARETVSVPIWQGGIADGAQFTDLLNGGTYSVQGGALTLSSLSAGAALILEEAR